MSHIYLGAVAFGVTLLVASFLLGGKDADAGDGGGEAGDGGGEAGEGHADFGLAWAPIGSVRFWVFVFTFGGGTGLALTQLGSGTTVTAVGAAGIGWVAGALAVTIIRRMTRDNVSSQIAASDLIGLTGKLVLPVAPGQPGKVRLEIKGRSEDFVAHVDEAGTLATGATVLIVAERDHGALLVTKHEM